MVFADDDSRLVLHRGLPLLIALTVAASGGTLAISVATLNACPTLSTCVIAVSSLLLAASLACEHLRHRNKSLHDNANLVLWIICAVLSLLAPLAALGYALYGISLLVDASSLDIPAAAAALGAESPCAQAPLFPVAILAIVLTVIAAVVYLPTSLWVIFSRMVFMKPALWWSDYDAHINDIRWVRSALGDLVPVLVLRSGLQSQVRPSLDIYILLVIYILLTQIKRAVQLLKR